MLCRTASDLFWMGRAVERAEAMARLLDLARRLAELPGRDGDRVWALPLLATGAIPPGVAGDDATQAELVRRCVLDAHNPASVLASVQLARDAARNQRSVVPAEVAAPLQTMLARLRGLDPGQLDGGGLARVVAAVMRFADRFRGVTFATLSRNEAWHFLRLGLFIERADAALRLWTTQADPEFVLLRDGPESARAAFHRAALLEAASALMPLRRLHGAPDRAGVTEMLLRRGDFPRSAAYSLEQAQRALAALQVAPHDAAARQLGRALAGVSYAEPGAQADAMFAFGAARQAEIAAAAAAIDRRFFVAPLPLRRAA